MKSFKLVGEMRRGSADFVGADGRQEDLYQARI
jgi:hypothetical protein